MALLTGNEIIEIAVNLEESGEAFYTAAATGAADIEIKKLFRDLAIQERQHRCVFQEMIAPADRAVEFVLSSEQWDEFQAYTDALLKQSFFASPENALIQASEAQNAQEALLAAIQFEKESLLFFYELREVVQGTEKGSVSRIIREERRHVQRLSERLT